jgi:hypothetical protein
MSTAPRATPDDLPEVTAAVPPEHSTHTEGFSVKPTAEDTPEMRVDRIEMIGEEVASGFPLPGQSQVTPGMRYLHCSRTIHQLVSDRNRAVGLYIAVATVLWTASTALFNARPDSDLIIPLDVIKRWCLPVTFGSMTALAVFVAFLLIRTRIGLIYEVAKMNVLLGLPIGRVKRINPLSLFFIMHAMVSLAGGGSAALFSMHMLRLAGVELEHVALPSVLIGLAVGVTLMLLYVFTVLHTTSDQKLQGGGRMTP